MAEEVAPGWTKEFPHDNPGVYWVRLVGMDDQHVIAYCSKEHVHYTNGERQHARVGGYEFFGPITPQNTVAQAAVAEKDAARLTLLRELADLPLIVPGSQATVFRSIRRIQEQTRALEAARTYEKGK